MQTSISEGLAMSQIERCSACPKRTAACDRLGGIIECLFRKKESAPMISRDDSGYLHFTIGSKAFKTHPARAGFLVLIPRKEIESGLPHWAPASLRWRDLPKSLQNELLAAGEEQEAIARNAVNAIRNDAAHHERPPV
jgi:hypothetical protein